MAMFIVQEITKKETNINYYELLIVPLVTPEQLQIIYSLLESKVQYNNLTYLQHVDKYKLLLWVTVFLETKIKTVRKQYLKSIYFRQLKAI